MDLAELCKVVNDGHGRLGIRAQALADRLLVVIRAAGRLAALEQALNHDSLRHVVHEHGVDGRRVADDALPAVDVVRVAGEAVDEELGRARRAHRRVDEADRHLDGHDAALADRRLDHLRRGPAARALLAQQVARR